MLLIIEARGSEQTEEVDEKPGCVLGVCDASLRSVVKLSDGIVCGQGWFEAAVRAAATRFLSCALCIMWSDCCIACGMKYAEVGR